MGKPKPVALRQLMTGKIEKLDDRLIEEVHQVFLKLIDSAYALHPGIKEIAGTSELFTKLSENNIKIALTTGFNTVTAKIIINRLWPNMHNLLCVASDEIERGRPFPDIVYKAIEKAVLDKNLVNEAVIVGDTVADMQTGVNAGLQARIGVLSGTGSETELKNAGATIILNSVANLAV
jgi:phosphonatase-like hydrolase